jgi:hypothetical protein
VQAFPCLPFGKAGFTAQAGFSAQAVFTCLLSHKILQSQSIESLRSGGAGMKASLEQLHDIFATDRRDPDAFADYRCLRICGDLFSLCRMRIFRSNKDRESTQRAKRGAITEFSDISRKRMARDLRSRIYGWRISRFLTFSYPAEYPLDGHAFKAHWKGMLDRIQSRWPGVRVFWFLEFQKRGAPHFHAFVGCPMHHYKLKELWDSATAGTGGFVYITNWAKIRNNKTPWRYALKYSAKQEQKEVPSFISNVGRFWGWRNPPEKIDAHCAIDALDLPYSADFMVAKFLEILKTGKEFFLSFDIPYLEFYSSSSQSKSHALKLQSSINIFNAYCRHLRTCHLNAVQSRLDYEVLALKDF